jgi:hypothetical protein
MAIATSYRVVVAVISSAIICFPLDAQELTLQGVIDAWRARQERTRSAFFHWSESVTKPKGSMRSSKSLPNRGTTIPPEDMILTFDSSLAIDAQKVCYRTKGDFWADEQGAFRPQRYASAFNGKQGKTYWPADVRHARGFLESSGSNEELSSYHLKPLLIVYRSLDRKMRGLDPRRLTLPALTAIVDERKCRCVEFSRGPGVVERFWVDCERDSSVSRYMLSSNDKVLIQIDWNYRRQQADGWIPSRWRITVNNPDGTLETSVVATVASASLNPAIDPREFEIDFPEGTLVYDKEKREEFIVRPDGGRRVITEQERGASYEELRKSPSGMALADQRQGWWKWGLLLVVTCLLVLFCVLRAIRRRTG